MSKPKPAKQPAAPKFASEAEERRFWESHDVTGYFDWTRAVQLRFPAFKPVRPRRGAR